MNPLAKNTLRAELMSRDDAAARSLNAAPEPSRGGGLSEGLGYQAEHIGRNPVFF